MKAPLIFIFALAATPVLADTPNDGCIAAGDLAISARTPQVDLYDSAQGKRVQTLDAAKFPACAPITGRAPNMMLQVNVSGTKYWVPPYMVKYRFSGKLPPYAAISQSDRTSKRSAPRAVWAKAARRREANDAQGILPLSLASLLLLSSSAGASMLDSNGYPSKGKAIEKFKPSADYSDVLKGRPLALGFMRTRGQGFVPSRELQTTMCMA
ncbi:MAG: hypothetical protein WDM89_03550 [Rhizomicrobium sp.]